MQYTTVLDVSDKSFESIIQNAMAFEDSKILAAIQSQTNYQTIEAFQDYYYLSYMQSHAIEEYAKSKITDKEIEDYYKNKSITG